jgi:hypothetical protein
MHDRHSGGFQRRIELPHLPYTDGTLHIRAIHVIRSIQDATRDGVIAMAWKWYEIARYKASVGGGPYYGGVQLFGEEFYAYFRFMKVGPLPSAFAPTTHGQRFYGFLDFQQMATMVDLLRNEEPVRFGWSDQDPNLFHLMTGTEPVGEGDGQIAHDSNA